MLSWLQPHLQRGRCSHIAEVQHWQDCHPESGLQLACFGPLIWAAAAAHQDAINQRHHTWLDTPPSSAQELPSLLPSSSLYTCKEHCCSCLILQHLPWPTCGAGARQVTPATHPSKTKQGRWGFHTCLPLASSLLRALRTADCGEGEGARACPVVPSPLPGAGVGLEPSTPGSRMLWYPWPTRATS